MIKLQMLSQNWSKFSNETSLYGEGLDFLGVAKTGCWNSKGWSNEVLGVVKWGSRGWSSDIPEGSEMKLQGRSSEPAQRQFSQNVPWTLRHETGYTYFLAPCYQIFGRNQHIYQIIDERVCERKILKKNSVKENSKYRNPQNCLRV